MLTRQFRTSGVKSCHHVRTYNNLTEFFFAVGKMLRYLFRCYCVSLGLG